MQDSEQLIAGRYRLVTALASGGMGVVWQGWDDRLQRAVAIKQLRLQPGLSPSETAAARDRVMREARITARLHHAHAVPVYDVVEHEGQPCLIMQFFPSVSLQEAVKQRGPLPAVEVARIGSEIATALTAAHEAGVVHRDVKPGNVLIGEDGASKLTDFGISHALDDVTLTATGMLTGTPAYLAPEVARGQPASFASDVFSLGSTLYAAIEGGPPFGQDDNAMAVLHRVASGQLRPPQRSGPLTPLLLRMLSPQPQDRPSMTDVGYTLAALHTDLTALAAPVAWPATLTISRPEAPRRSDAAAPKAEPTERRPPRAEPAPRAAAEAVGRGDPNPGGDAAAAVRKDGPISGPAPAALRKAQPTPRAAPTSKGPRSAADQHGPTQWSTPVQPRRRRPRRGRIAVGALAALAVAGAVLAISLSGGKSDTSSKTPSNGAAGRTTSALSNSAPTSTVPSPAITNSEPSPTGASRSASIGPAAAALDAQLKRAVADYYGLMPSNLAAGWARLTAAYQTSHAGGFAVYQQFWSQVSRVSVSNAGGQGPNSAQATITYVYKSGRVVVEQTTFRLVQSGGRWKIDQTTVLNSQSS